MMDSTYPAALPMLLAIPAPARPVFGTGGQPAVRYSPLRRTAYMGHGRGDFPAGAALLAR